jgi:hypothetical protein
VGVTGGGGYVASSQTKQILHTSGDVTEHSLHWFPCQQAGGQPVKEPSLSLPPLCSGPLGESGREQRTDRGRYDEEHQERQEIFRFADAERVDRWSEEEVEREEGEN